VTVDFQRMGEACGRWRGVIASTSHTRIRPPFNCTDGFVDLIVAEHLDNASKMGHFPYHTMLILPLLLTLWSMPASQQPDSLVLADFSRSTAADWLAVNDGVMGGISSSTMEVTSDGTGVFAGRLSLENNGGFASVRTVLESGDLSRFVGLVLRVRGDGRRYQVRLRTDARFDGLAYQAEFDTAPGRWTTVVLPFDTFAPTFRGYVPRNAPPLDPGAIRQLGFLIGDKREGVFRLEVQRIVAVSSLPQDP